MWKLRPSRKGGHERSVSEACIAVNPSGGIRVPWFICRTRCPVPPTTNMPRPSSSQVTQIMLERMREVCAKEHVGPEYLLLLLLSPLSSAEHHYVRPQRLLRALLLTVQENEQEHIFDIGDRGTAVSSAFAREVSLYVKTQSTIQSFGEGLILPEPGVDCRVDILFSETFAKKESTNVFCLF